MAEYIDRQAATELIDDCLLRDEKLQSVEKETLLAVKRWIDAIPPADVRPVVRCRDCFANGLCSVQDVLFNNDLDKTKKFYCAMGKKEDK